MKKSKFTFFVLNDKGLHTRPSTELVKCAARFHSSIFLIYKGLAVNAKSLLGILTLGAQKGSKLTIEAQGPDADQAIEALAALARNQFNIQY